MDNLNELNRKILDTVDKIRKDHPELIKYLDEMPITLPTENNPKMNVEQLKAYLDSLLHLQTEADLK
jgi:hypothetical protein